jgi:hypothetical protein
MSFFIRQITAKENNTISSRANARVTLLVDMNVNDFDCHDLFDLSASISIMPRMIYDMLGLPPLENCYF